MKLFQRLACPVTCRSLVIVVAALLVLQAAQVAYIVHRESLTWDEDDHMFAGYMMWKAGDYGLVRREGLSFVIPGRGVAAMNMTHVEMPLEPLAATLKGIEGKEQADRAFAFLKNEFPACFGKARIRSYGFPGIRQTRWIVGRQQLSVDDVRAGTKFPDYRILPNVIAMNV